MRSYLHYLSWTVKKVPK